MILSNSASPTKLITIHLTTWDVPSLHILCQTWLGPVCQIWGERTEPIQAFYPVFSMWELIRYWWSTYVQTWGNCNSNSNDYLFTVIVIVNLILKVIVIVIVDKVIVIHYYFAITFCQTHNTFCQICHRTVKSHCHLIGCSIKLSFGRKHRQRIWWSMAFRLPGFSTEPDSDDEDDIYKRLADQQESLL